MDSTVIVAIIGGAVTIFNVIFSTVMANKSEKKRQKDVEEMRQNDRTNQLESGVQCLLRAEIIRSHEKYMDKGFCPVYAREALSRAYEAYHALGGNGTITGLYNQIIALPTDKEEN
ncbi:MAG: hypothetical protein J6A19_05205 [Oscillospiraceae bacterium]|nr:hypothetical protein [Oscillospiraceae bacterium]